MLTKLICVLGVLALLTGCGEGPRHLSKSDYQHGKAAFASLEGYEQAWDQPLARSQAYHFAAAEQMGMIHSKALRESLHVYETAISQKISARAALASAEAEIKSAASGKKDVAFLGPLDEWHTDAIETARDIDPIVEACREDAAGYFDAHFAGAPMCEKTFSAYLLKYKVPEIHVP